MTKRILLSGLAASMLTTSAFASNGANIIGSSVESRAMGGVSVATYTGTDAAQNNPAMLTSNEGNRLDIADTILISNANVVAPAGVLGATATDEDYGTTSPLLPNIGYATNLSKDLVAAVNMSATAGGAVAWGSTTFMGGTEMSLGVMEITPAVAYKTGDISIGVALPIAYAMYSSVNATNTDDAYDASTSVGYTVGLAYAMDNITLGAMYKGARAIHNVATKANGGTPAANGSDDNYMPLPAEMGFGVNYKMGTTTIALDYKSILWSGSGVPAADLKEADGSDAGFATFGAEDQTVIALGASSELSKELTVMAGVNYGSFALDQVNGVDNMTLAMLPMQATTHITAGANFALSADMEVGGAFTYALPSTEESTAGGIEWTASQMAITVGLSMKL